MVQHDDKALAGRELGEQLGDDRLPDDVVLDTVLTGRGRDQAEVSFSSARASAVVDEPALRAGDQPSDREVVETTAAQRPHRCHERVLGEVLGGGPIVAAPPEQVREDLADRSVEELAEPDGVVAGANRAQQLGVPRLGHPRHILLNARGLHSPSRAICGGSGVSTAGRPPDPIPGGAPHRPPRRAR